MRHWPVLNLRLTTPRLELRLPSLDDLDELADRALEGVHDPDVMPFGVPWTDVPADELPGNVIRYQLGIISRWQRERWCCNFVVVHEGQVIGTQDLSAGSFPVTREVSTGSWLGRAHQGKGLGTEMRAAVLHLAFTGLGAQTAVSSAFWTTPPRWASPTSSATSPTGCRSTRYAAGGRSSNACASTGPTSPTRCR
ncbi:GNAT family N-acetyltransferase [Nonomuraea sp. NPDC049784]|uniref:GNAT family N-acetyltransferase n=1 Tax=Nonomuraea sp. NPDC049784 TaxID=3154361 RepID=UPI003401DD7E